MGSGEDLGGGNETPSTRAVQISVGCRRNA